jgi:hypothetical protein
MNNTIFKYGLMLVLGISSLHTGAQYSFTGLRNTNVAVQSVMALNIIPNNYTINYNTIDQIENGITANLNTIQVKSNNLWRLTVAASNPFFTASGRDATSNMPVSILEFGIQGQTGTIRLSTAHQMLSSGGRGDFNKPGNSFTLTLKTGSAFDYGPGSYSVSVTYTLTAQ